MSVFTGARVSTPTTTIPSGVATIIEWTTEDFDDGDWFDPLAKTEYVVPAGITRVVVTTGCGFPADNAGYRSVEILHTSGATVTTRGHVRDDAADSGKTIMHTTTGPLAVAAGDRLSVRIKQNSGSDLLLKSDVHGSYFSIEDATEGEAGVSVEDHDLLENRVTVNEDESQSQDIRLDVLEAAPAPTPGLTADVHDIVDLSGTSPSSASLLGTPTLFQFRNVARSFTVTLDGVIANISVTAAQNNNITNFLIAARADIANSPLDGILFVSNDPSTEQNSSVKLSVGGGVFNGDILVSGPDAVAVFGTNPIVVTGSKGLNWDVSPTLPTDGSEIIARVRTNFDVTSAHHGSTSFAGGDSAEEEFLYLKFIGGNVSPFAQLRGLQIKIDGTNFLGNLPRGWGVL